MNDTGKHAARHGPKPDPSQFYNEVNRRTAEENSPTWCLAHILHKTRSGQPHDMLEQLALESSDPDEVVRLAAEEKCFLAEEAIRQVIVLEALGQNMQTSLEASIKTLAHGYEKLTDIVLQTMDPDGNKQTEPSTFQEHLLQDFAISIKIVIDGKSIAEALQDAAEEYANLVRETVNQVAQEFGIGEQERER